MSHLLNKAYLDDGSFTGDFKDLTLSGLAVFQLDVDDLSKPRQEYAVSKGAQDDQQGRR